MGPTNSTTQITGPWVGPTSREVPYQVHTCILQSKSSLVTNKWLLEHGIIWLSIVDEDFIKMYGNKDEYGWRYYWINGRQDRVQSPHLLKCLLCVCLVFLLPSPLTITLTHEIESFPPLFSFSLPLFLSFHLCFRISSNGHLLPTDDLCISLILPLKVVSFCFGYRGIWSQCSILDWIHICLMVDGSFQCFLF